MSAGTTGPQAVGNAPTQKVCEACGEKFPCNASAAGCWCEQLRLDKRTLSELRARHSDCLCPRCLSAVQTISSSDKSA
jgi:Cysteine-rich CWC